MRHWNQSGPVLLTISYIQCCLPEVRHIEKGVTHTKTLTKSQLHKRLNKMCSRNPPNRVATSRSESLDSIEVQEETVIWHHWRKRILRKRSDVVDRRLAGKQSLQHDPENTSQRENITMVWPKHIHINQTLIYATARSKGKLYDGKFYITELPHLRGLISTSAELPHLRGLISTSTELLHLRGLQKATHTHW